MLACRLGVMSKFVAIAIRAWVPENVAGCKNLSVNRVSNIKKQGYLSKPTHVCLFGLALIVTDQRD